MRRGDGERKVGMMVRETREGEERKIGRGQEARLRGGGVRRMEIGPRVRRNCVQIISELWMNGGHMLEFVVHYIFITEMTIKGSRREIIKEHYMSYLWNQ